MINEVKKVVKLTKVDELKRDMVIIRDSADFIENTIRNLINNSGTVYEEDLKKSLELIQNIKSYADGKIKDDEVLGVNLIFSEDLLNKK